MSVPEMQQGSLLKADYARGIGPRQRVYEFTTYAMRDLSSTTLRDSPYRPRMSMLRLGRKQPGGSVAQLAATSSRVFVLSALHRDIGNFA
jgi:hypothetical protein